MLKVFWRSKKHLNRFRLLVNLIQSLLRRFKEYPEARKSIEQKAKMPLTGSFSGAEFYVVNAFILWAPMDKNSQRWSMHPHSKFISRPKEQRDQADHDFLFKDIKNVWLKGRSIGT
jgi:catalase